MSITYIFKQYKLFSRKTVLSGRFNTPHPFDLDVFEDNIYYSDWTKMSIIKTNLFNGRETMNELVHSEHKYFRSVKIIHPLKQPTGNVFRYVILEVFLKIFSIAFFNEDLLYLLTKVLSCLFKAFVANSAEIINTQR